MSFAVYNVNKFYKKNIQFVENKHTDTRSKVDEVEKLLTAIDGQIDRDVSSIREIREIIANIKDDVDALEVADTGLTGSLNGLTSKVNTAENAINGLISKVNNAEASINTLTPKVNGVGASITSLNSKVSGAENAINALNTKVNEIETVNANYASVIQGMERSIEALQNAMGSNP